MNPIIDQFMDRFQCEYDAALKEQTSGQARSINKKLRTVRIFISSTFKDFHNERNYLVKNVFPRLREWCSHKHLYLVECDLRWGIPSDVSREGTLITCMEEIDKGRKECAGMNFFLGLIGERYGWIPENDVVTDFVRERYNWIEGTSVTVMEFIHGIIRTLTPNGLIMIRSSEFLDNIPDVLKLDFTEEIEENKRRQKHFKSFIRKSFKDRSILYDYDANFGGTIFDGLLDRHRVLLKGFEQFGKIIETHFKSCIENNILPRIERIRDEDIEECQEYMIRCLGDRCFSNHHAVTDLMAEFHKIQIGKSNNPIIILSGEAGVGKSTVVAFCVKLMRKSRNKLVFYHNASCSIGSKYRKSITYRIGKFLNRTITKKKELRHILEFGIDDDVDLSDSTISSSNRPSNTVSYIFIDGIDEMDIKIFDWIPQRTCRRFFLIIACLFDQHRDSFYSKLMTSKRHLREIKMRPLDKEDVSKIINDYLCDFGKKLDQNQLDSLMAFESSKNPLWLTTVCEELRIHGNFETLQTVILNLPPKIQDLNRTIIRRLINEDELKIVQTFFILLSESRAGIWESLVKDMIPFVMDDQSNKKLSQAVWCDVMRQVKGFLQIPALPLPLIKFRHRITKESIIEELALVETEKVSLHRKLVEFFRIINGELNESGLYLPDYFYHLVKANQRNRIVEFMRMKSSWSLFKSSHVRSKIINSMRCSNLLIRQTKTFEQPLKMCFLCSNKTNDLSIYAVNKFSCFFCGNFVGSLQTGKLFMCPSHAMKHTIHSFCALCDEIIWDGKGENLRTCHYCQIANSTNFCGVIIRENDHVYQSQISSSRGMYNLLSYL